MYYQSMKKNIWMQIFFITISSTRVTRELSFTIFSFVDLSQILLALSFLKDQIMCTGWFKANLDTLTYYYDKNTMCTEKIMIDLFSVYPDISFDNNNSDKIT